MFEHLKKNIELSHARVVLCHIFKEEYGQLNPEDLLLIDSYLFGHSDIPSVLAPLAHIIMDNNDESNFENMANKLEGFTSTVIKHLQLLLSKSKEKKKPISEMSIEEIDTFLDNILKNKKL